MRVSALYRIPHTTMLVLVSRPEQSALAEADRTRAELGRDGCNQSGPHSERNLCRRGTAAIRPRWRWKSRGRDALDAMPVGLADLPRVDVPLLPYAPMGVSRLRRPAGRQRSKTSQSAASRSGARPKAPMPGGTYRRAREERPRRDHDHGQGRSGKDHRRRGHCHRIGSPRAPGPSQHDRPAAHVAATVGSPVPGLSVGRIDPAEETRRYSEGVIASAGGISRRTGPGASGRGSAVPLHGRDCRLQRLRRDRRPGRTRLCGAGHGAHRPLHSAAGRGRGVSP